eukprot:GHVT01016081.1.p1 GENE.GHVT01016081.1~~GHVT01016081.1.p1  ORF type:complete len:400 (-),score=118.34 GHVT01016081.1:261-1460(-)
MDDPGDECAGAFPPQCASVALRIVCMEILQEAPLPPLDPTHSPASGKPLASVPTLLLCGPLVPPPTPPAANPASAKWEALRVINPRAGSSVPAHAGARASLPAAPGPPPSLAAPPAAPGPPPSLAAPPAAVAGPARRALVQFPAVSAWPLCPRVSAALVLALWPRSADGLRFDSVHNMPWKFLQELTAGLRAAFPGRILIAEVTPENPKICNDAGFDSCWIHSGYYDMIQIMQKRDGGRAVDMVQSMVAMHSGFTRSFQGVLSILGSHDQTGNKHPNGASDGRRGRYLVDLLGGAANWHARAQCRMWFALQSFGRCLPLVFMGAENLQEGWWDATAARAFDWPRALAAAGHAREMRSLVISCNALRATLPALTKVDEPVKFVHVDTVNQVLGEFAAAVY